MTEEHVPSIIIPMEQTVWFRSGEKISDLVSLSLEPNITIQDSGPFISIRGTLSMYGEYKKLPDTGDRREENGTFHPKQYVFVSETGMADVYEFQYDFPVDLTIPKDRVHNLEDLDVIIENFDYTSPAPDRLTLTMNIAITGIRSDAKVIERENILSQTGDESAELALEEPDEIQNDIRPLQLSAENERTGKKDEDIFFAEAKKEEETDAAEEHEQNLQIPVPIMRNREDARDDDIGKNREQHDEPEEAGPDRETAGQPEEIEEHAVEEIQEVADGMQDEPESEPLTRNAGQNTASDQNDENETESDKEETRDRRQTKEQITAAAGSEESTSSETVTAGREEEEEQVEQDDAEDEREEKNINYQSQDEEEEEESISLTEFFARKDENPVTKMKIYIVQPEDTLHLIADRYEVSVSQLLRTNRLEPNQDVYEGQVLYIPVKQKSPSSS